MLFSRPYLVLLKLALAVLLMVTPARSQETTADWSASLIVDVVDQAIARVSPTSTGIQGSLLMSVPGTSAHDLSITLQTLKEMLDADAKSLLIEQAYQDARSFQSSSDIVFVAIAEKDVFFISLDQFTSASFLKGNLITIRDLLGKRNVN